MVSTKTTQKMIYEFIKMNEGKHLLITGEEGFTIQDIATQFKAKYTAISRTLNRMLTSELYPLGLSKDGTVARYSLIMDDKSRPIPIDMKRFWDDEFIPYLQINQHELLSKIRDHSGGTMKSGGGFQTTIKNTIDVLIEMGIINTESIKLIGL